MSQNQNPRGQINCGCKNLKLPTRLIPNNSNTQISVDPEPSTSTSSIGEPGSSPSSNNDPENVPGGVDGLLRYCQTQILYPYFRILGTIGLKPLKNTNESDSCPAGRCLNWIYIGFLVIILGVGYALQYLSCYRRDCGFVHAGESLNLEDPPTHNTPNWLHHCKSGENSFFIHILPSCLHFGAFVYMIYLYRFHDDEQLPNLLERVFLQIGHVQTQYFSHKKLVRSLQVFLVSGTIWISTCLGTRIFEVVTGDTVVLSYGPILSNELKRGLISMLVLSTTWGDGIQITILTSYAVHCYLLSTHLKLLRLRLLQSPLCLAEGMKELGECQRLLNYLNYRLGVPIGLLMIHDIGFLSSGLIYLFRPSGTAEVSSLSLSQGFVIGLNLVIWTALIFMPIISGLEVSRWTKSVRELGQTLRLKPFGYERVPDSELDSFLLFVSSLNFQIRIWGGPIGKNWISMIILGSWTLLLIWGLLG